MQSLHSQSVHAFSMIAKALQENIHVQHKVTHGNYKMDTNSQ